MNFLRKKKNLTLILGGTGKTGRRVAERLKAKGHEVRVGSRSAVPSFDWDNEKGWDAALKDVLRSVPFEDICITSTISVTGDAAPDDAFRVSEVPGLAVVFEKAVGAKCGRCWKVLPDVGQHSHAGVCGRCDAALG